MDFNSDDSEHLRLLADWFDHEQEIGRWENSGFEVQCDLRRIADTIDFERTAVDTTN